MTLHVHIDRQGLRALPPRDRVKAATEAIETASGTVVRELDLIRSYAILDWIREYDGAHGAQAAIARELGVSRSRVGTLAKPARDDIAEREQAQRTQELRAAYLAGEPLPPERAAQIEQAAAERAAQIDRDYAEELGGYPEARTRSVINTMSLIRDYLDGVVADVEQEDWEGALALLAAIESAARVARDHVTGDVPDELKEEAADILSGKPRPWEVDDDE